jgi:hypothetical protein
MRVVRIARRHSGRHIFRIFPRHTDEAVDPSPNHIASVSNFENTESERAKNDPG